MRIVFMGTPDFAAVSLQRLLDAHFDVVGVFTQPDKPKNRGMKLQPSPVKEIALANGLPVFQPEKMRDGTALAALRSLQPDILVVVAYGRILPDELLAAAPLGAINVHGSLLPKYRGAAPIQWAVLNGDAVTGVSTMYLDREMDTGDVIYTEQTPVGEFETAGELFDRLAVMGADLLVRTLRDVDAGVAARRRITALRRIPARSRATIRPLTGVRARARSSSTSAASSRGRSLRRSLAGRRLRSTPPIIQTARRAKHPERSWQPVRTVSPSPVPMGRRCASRSCRRRAKSVCPQPTTCLGTRCPLRAEYGYDCTGSGMDRAAALAQKRRMVGCRAQHRAAECAAFAA